MIRRPKLGGIRAALPILSIGLFASCSVTDPEVGVEDELSRALAQWRASGITDYRYVVERHCFCVPEAIGPAEVVVQGGGISVFDANGNPYPADFAGLFPDVDGLFEIVREALRAGAEDVRVTYSSTLGYPTEIDIDYLLNAVDDELVVLARDLVPIS